METVEGTKYFNIVFDEDKGSPEKMTDCLVIFNGSQESLRDIVVSETEGERAPQHRPESGRKSEKKSQRDLQQRLGSEDLLLSDVVRNKKSEHLSSSRTSCEQQPDQLMLIGKKGESLIISELKSKNASPFDDEVSLGDDRLASGRSSKQPSRLIKDMEARPSASENFSLTSLPGNNNSQKKSLENQSAGDFSKQTGEPDTHAANRANNSMGRDQYFSYDDSEESIVSIAKIQSDREPSSSDRDISSLYSSESSSASARSSSGSTYTLSDPEYTNRSHGDHVPKSQGKPDILVINHSQHDSVAKRRVPVFLKAQAVLQNGELQVTVSDDRNSCPMNVNVKITVLHGPPRRKVSSKFAAYSVVPRIPRAPAVDRDIVKHRAMRPPFNTHVNPEAAQRHRRHFGLD